jgi:hypothetical protein
VELKVKQIAGVLCTVSLLCCPTPQNHESLRFQIEGLAWTIMSFICIILYNSETIYIGTMSYWNLVEYSMYTMFFISKYQKVFCQSRE